MINKTYDIDIKVSTRILRHMSRGIYRTPAGALKELVSNAHDAGATKVTISTEYYDFEKITITDNGKGILYNEFVQLMQHIGYTDKVAGTKFKIPNSNVERVTIGHYGVGLLAIGQLASSVKITSKTKNSTDGFEAWLDFEQFEKKQIEGVQRSIVKDEQDLEKKDKPGDEQPSFTIGKCTITHKSYSEKDKKESFTRLELQNIRDVVQQKLSGRLRKSYGDIQTEKQYTANFEELLKLYREKEDEIRRGQYPYEKLCWELALYCPVRYPHLKIFSSNPNFNYIKKLAEKTDFELVVDGMIIFKPFESIFFENTNYPIRNIFSWKDEKYYNNEKVSGYIIVRQHIRPKSLQGILVREAGVAIGTYDLTFLEYPYHEAVKFEQLTGELFVEGLSGSLNIDRNSFNETDEKYLALVKWFHNKLHDEVFRALKKDMGVRRRESASKIFSNILKKYSDKYDSNFQITFENIGKGENLFHKKGKYLYINRNHLEGKLCKANVEKLFLASLLIISNIVTPEQMEDIFTKISSVKTE